MIRWINKFVILFLLFSVSILSYSAQTKISSKGAILQIVPANHATVTVPTSGQANVAFKVINNTRLSISQIVVSADYNAAANLIAVTTTSNNCSGKTLSSGASCQFTVNLQGKGAQGSTLLMPRVCGFDGTICSVPVAGDRVAVSVKNIIPPPKTLISITIIPASAIIQINGTQNFIARGTYSDGSTAIITQVVTWQVADSTIATIDTQGVATGLIRGDTTVTATLGNISAQAKLGVGRFAYITNSGSTQSVRNISFCLRDANDNLTNCVKSTGGAGPLSVPAGAVLDSTGSNLYFANNPFNVFRCTINNDGSINQCTIAVPLITTINVTGVAINPAGTFLYVTGPRVSAGNNTVFYCPINPNDGTVGACQITGDLSVNARAMTFNPEGNLAYITDTNNQVHYCPVNANGTLAPCTVAATGFTSPMGVTFNSNNMQLYVGSTSTRIFRCPVNPNGSLGTCVFAATGLSAPEYTVFNPTYTGALVTNSFNDTVLRCDVAANGDYNGCVATGAAFISPTGIAIYH